MEKDRIIEGYREVAVDLVIRLTTDHPAVAQDILRYLEEAYEHEKKRPEDGVRQGRLVLAEHLIRTMRVGVEGRKGEIL